MQYKAISLNDKKVINGWAMYDWANSVYSLVITSTIFPVYYNAVTDPDKKNLPIEFMGLHLPNTVLYSWALSLSFLIIAAISPFLSGIADYTDKKKSFMRFFSTLGSLACMGLFFFNAQTLTWGIICSIIASIGFAGSIVFYNAYLPEIATADQYDKVSAKGFAYGYVGSVLMMLFALFFIEKYKMFGLDGAGIATRITFILVGLWWLGFSQITFMRLPGAQKRISNENIFLKGYTELSKTFRKVISNRPIKLFLLSFFFYNMGVLTVVYLATSFGDKELKLDTGKLILTLLIIQVVALFGAYIFAWVSKRKGNTFSLKVMIFIWIFVCIMAYFVSSFGMFLGMALIAGLVVGGIQSLSRSTYSKLLPETEDHASFFSLFDVCDKLSVVIGTATFGVIENITGSMRISAIALSVFFIIGLLFLSSLKSPALLPSE